MFFCKSRSAEVTGYFFFGSPPQQKSTTRKPVEGTSDQKIACINSMTVPPEPKKVLLLLYYCCCTVLETRAMARGQRYRSRLNKRTPRPTEGWWCSSSRVMRVFSISPPIIRRMSSSCMYQITVSRVRVHGEKNKTKTHFGQPCSYSHSYHSSRTTTTVVLV